MATYTKINGKWRAQIRKVGYKHIAESFPTKAAAERWAQPIERAMDEGTYGKENVPQGTIGDVIKKYIKLRSATRPVADGSTEHYTLKTLSRMMGMTPMSEFTVEFLMGWAARCRDEGMNPYTVNCQLSKLSTVARYVESSLLPLIDGARPKLSYLGLIGANKPRERRPNAKELEQILQWLQQHRGLQMRDCVLFASLTAMRRSECTRLLWADIDLAHKMILVRDRKDPRQKIGNDQWVPLLYGSFELVLSQPRDSDKIFPIHPKALTKAFVECRKALGLQDIVLHDLRHEGISRMFEDGFDIPHVSIVSGHKSWSHLKRYTNIKPESLHSRAARQDTQQHPDSQQIDASHPHKSSP